MDTGSVKEIIVQSAANAAPLAFVGSHPMAGSEKGGAVHSRADLFQNAIWAIVSPGSDFAAAQEYVTKFVTALGAKPLYISADAHDEAVALTSHLPHVLAYTLCATLANRPEEDRERFLALSAGSWKSATRVAQSSPELWSEIVQQNASALAPLLRDFADKLYSTATALENGSTEAILQIFTDGNTAKRETHTT